MFMFAPMLGHIGLQFAASRISAGTDQARQARYDAYRQGALAGSVTSARYIIAMTRSHVEGARYQQLLQELQTAVPDVYAQAMAAGPLDDADDARGGLAELLRLGVHFAEPGAGHPNSYGHYNNTDPATLGLVAQLAALPLTPSSTSVIPHARGTPAFPSLPGAGGTPVPTHKPTEMSVHWGWVAAGIGVLVVLLVARHRTG